MSGAFPDLPNAHALASLLLTVIALYLFARERYPLEITSIGLLTVLAVGFSVFPFAADGVTLDPTAFFVGFGHQALVAVCALMVVGQGLVHTGALEPVGRLLARAWSHRPFLSLGLTLLVSAALSAFVNNTPIVVLLLPILVSVCLRTNTSPGSVLMPMGFATLIGGTATTIGTSTNLLVVSVAADLGVPRLGMFDFALPAAVAGALAILYLWLIAPRLLPARPIGLENVSPRVFDARLHIQEGNSLVGKTLADAGAAAGSHLRVSGLSRAEVLIQPLPDVVLRSGDQLRVRDTPQNLKAFEAALGAKLYSGGERVDEEHPLHAENQQLAEIVVVADSTLDGANLRYAQFLNRYQLAVLALHRAGEDIWKPHERIHDVTLQPGDVLLVQGPRDELAKIKQNAEFLVLDATVDLPHTAKAPLAFAILAGVVLLAALGIMPIAISAVGGAALMLLTRCLSLKAAIRAISPAVVFVVVASLALGRALVETGATLYVTNAFLALTAGASPTVILSSLMLLLAILTNAVSNNAAAVIGTPIAVSIAQQLGLPPEPFVLAVLFGANMSYATPMAYQTNLLVMNAGNYRFGEFLKVGIPLTLIMWAALTWLLSTLYL